MESQLNLSVLPEVRHRLPRPLSRYWSIGWFWIGPWFSTLVMFAPSPSDKLCAFFFYLFSEQSMIASKCKLPSLTLEAFPCALYPWPLGVHRLLLPKHAVLSRNPWKNHLEPRSSTIFITVPLGLKQSCPNTRIHDNKILFIRYLQFGYFIFLIFFIFFLF